MKNLLLPDIFLLSQNALSDGSLNGGLEFVPSGFVLNPGKDRGYERNHLEDTGFVLGNSAGTHIELLIFIELAHSGSVGALHVISIDFQLRLGLCLGTLGNDEIMVRLVCLGLLGIRSHNYLSVELDIGLAGRDTVEKLVRST